MTFECGPALDLGLASGARRLAASAGPNSLDETVGLRSGVIMPVLAGDGLEVLAFTLDLDPEINDATGVCLDDEERRRAAGLRLDRDRRRFCVARARLRRVLAAKLGISPCDVELEYGRFGKPHLSRRMPNRDLHFSVSRSQDVAVIALSVGQEVGVDIEAILPVPEADEIAALCFSASEYESYATLGPENRMEGFFLRWTRLEAISKALGCGLGQSNSRDEKDWVVRTFVPRSGYAGSVTIRNRCLDGVAPNEESQQSPFGCLGGAFVPLLSPAFCGHSREHGPALCQRTWYSFRSFSLPSRPTTSSFGSRVTG